MHDYLISSYKYGTEPFDLVKRRFPDLKITKRSKNTVCLHTEAEQAAKCACDILIYDIAQFEIADIISEFPFDLATKRSIFERAVVISNKAVLRYPVMRSLTEYFTEHSSLVLEGYVLFRMDDTAEIWERCVTKSIEDYLQECRLRELAGTFFRMISEGGSRIILIINTNSSFTLANDSGMQIDYPPQSEASLMYMLRSMSPDEIVLYDMSDGKNDDFINAVKKEFEAVRLV